MDTTMESRQMGATLQVIVQGALESRTLDELRRRLAVAWSEGISHVDIDLSRCSFLGAPAAALLVGAQRIAGYRGGGITLRQPSPAVLRFLAVSGLGRVLPVVGVRAASA